MTRYGMVIDVARCTGCFNCFLACRDEHAGNDHRPVSVAQPDGHSWIKVREVEMRFADWVSHFVSALFSGKVTLGVI